MSMQQDPSKSETKQCKICFWVAIFFFFIQILPWATAEYWYDEVLTITNFSLDPADRGLWCSVFRSYPIANNHILNSAIYFFWLKCVGPWLDHELLVRLPSILLGLATIVLIFRHWQKFLGEKSAAIASLLFAVSPVTTAYVWQIRGYSLSLFLAACALSGMMEWQKGKQLYGKMITSISCLLLPLVIPSNAMLAPVIAAALFFTSKNWKDRLLSLMIPGGATALGLSYYLTIWPQFQQAMAEPDGWPSIGLVCGALAAGLLAHLFGLLPFVCKKLRVHQTSYCLAGGCIGVILLVLMLARAGHAPFPRVFLVLFPAFTLALLFCLKNCNFSLKHVALCCFLSGTIITLLCNQWLPGALKRGLVPDNLLVQYYRGSTELRFAAAAVRQYAKNSPVTIVTDPYDFPAFQFYWCLFGGDAMAVIPSNQMKQRPSGEILVLGRTKAFGQEILQKENPNPFFSWQIRSLYNLNP